MKFEKDEEENIVSVDCTEHSMYKRAQAIIENLRIENRGLQERIDKLDSIQFKQANEVPNPPDIFQVSKDADLIKEHFYPNQSIMEAMKKLKPFLGQPEMRIDLAWRVTN